MAKIVTMGEIMLRLSTPNNEKFIQANQFDINYGGGEANVAVSLANYGHEAEFITAVPDTAAISSEKNMKQRALPPSKNPAHTAMSFMSPAPSAPMENTG